MHIREFVDVRAYTSVAAPDRYPEFGKGDAAINPWNDHAGDRWFWGSKESGTTRAGEQFDIVISLQDQF
jgi:hypothetical protein